MPYSRRCFFRRRRRPRMPYPRKLVPVAPGGSTWSSYMSSAKDYGLLALAAYRGVKYLSGLVNSEKFKLDTTVSVNPDNSSGSVIHLTGAASGDTDSSRTGNSIFVRSLYCRFRIDKHASATNTNVRILLVVNKQQVADTAPAITDVLESVDTTAPLNNATVGRFSILWDRTFNVNSVSQPTYNTQLYKPMKLHCRYNGTAGTDIQKNGIYLLIFSNEATNTPAVNGLFRVSYHDN